MNPRPARIGGFSWSEVSHESAGSKEAPILVSGIVDRESLAKWARFRALRGAPYIMAPTDVSYPWNQTRTL
jgi:hypothetical protein